MRDLELRYASRLHADPIGGIAYMFLNTRVPPFDNLDARRAVNEAVDRDRLVELLGGPDAATATCQSLPPGFPGYQPYCPYGSRPSPAGTAGPPDLDEARRLVARSGTYGQHVLVWAPADHAAVARYFAQLLRRLGYRARSHIVGTRGNQRVLRADRHPEHAGPDRLGGLDPRLHLRRRLHPAARTAAAASPRTIPAPPPTNRGSATLASRRRSARPNGSSSRIRSPAHRRGRLSTE